jgi:hypothetical protein
MPYTVKNIIDKLHELYQDNDILLIDWWDISNVHLLAHGLGLELSQAQEESILKEVINHFEVGGIDTKHAVFDAIIQALKNQYPECHKVHVESDIKLTDEVEIYLNGVLQDKDKQ